MPLRDHFHPPLSDRASWEGVHGGWPMVIVQHLGKTLPDRFIAEPRVRLGAQVEVDVATLDVSGGPAGDLQPEIGSGISTFYAPAAPTLAVETELADADEYEVRVYDSKRGRRLVAAVEIVSPANKGSPRAPRAVRGQMRRVAETARLGRAGRSGHDA